ncbi:hypothetical protein PAXINDRAFT_17634 [Paxillus involutus ATCC 200175]|uniref:Uncharacterized protein n=1 Tax=Paxillus involutus ATCC 200175 TaxID=664439 RepID=A0A0C9TN66_PAXIN|nr:hypothetical protein PAXINDRAFT_17634 [Paxillus involutus ATCC 200175]
MEAPHHTLKEDLIAWQRKQVVNDGLDDDFFGPQLILTDPILTRIINLSHHSKLPDISALKAQTNWVFAQEYGNAILALAHKHFPPKPNPVPPTTHATSGSAIPSTSSGQPTGGLPASSGTVATATAKKPRKPTQCSKCKGLGHNMANRLCPLWTPKQPT